MADSPLVPLSIMPPGRQSLPPIAQNSTAVVPAALIMHVRSDRFDLIASGSKGTSASPSCSPSQNPGRPASSGEACPVRKSNVTVGNAARSSGFSGRPCPAMSLGLAHTTVRIAPMRVATRLLSGRGRFAPRYRHGGRAAEDSGPIAAAGCRSPDRPPKNP